MGWARTEEAVLVSGIIQIFLPGPSRVTRGSTVMIVGGFLGLTLTGAWASVGGRGRERPLRERLAVWGEGL